MSADLLREEGNRLFCDQNYRHAISKYEEAISLDPQNDILYTNTANCHFKLLQYEEALYYACEALHLAPSKVKPMYYRALALNSLHRYFEAMKQCDKILALEPANALVKAKKVEFERNLRKEQFEEAIHIAPVVLTQEYIDKLDVPSSYSGPVWTGDLTVSFVKDLMTFFKKPVAKLPLKYALQIVLWARQILVTNKALVHIRFKDQKDTMTLCGDIHGQFLDLVNIFELYGFPSTSHYYLFNGDFVDRGPASIPCILTLFALKCLFPDTFFMARGNHESFHINKLYGFETDIRSVYPEDDNTYLFFQNAFEALPLCHVVQDKLFVTHGGLPANPEVTLDEIADLDRFHDPSTVTSIMHDLCWADPRSELGVGPNHRGTSIAFGPDITERFLAHNNLQLLVRSHEFQENGYCLNHNGKCITIFSAPNYVNGANKGAVIQVAFDGSIAFETFDAVTS